MGFAIHISGHYFWLTVPLCFGFTFLLKIRFFLKLYLGTLSNTGILLEWGWGLLSRRENLKKMKKNMQTLPSLWFDLKLDVDADSINTTNNHCQKTSSKNWLFAVKMNTAQFQQSESTCVVSWVHYEKVWAICKLDYLYYIWGGVHI